MDQEKVASAPESPDAEMQKALEHRARLFRRIGFGFFGGLLVVMAAFLIYSAFHDIHEGTVLDPFTHEKTVLK